MHNIEWIFSGMGTTVLASLFSLAIGTFAGYRIGINKNKQLQVSGKDAKQFQKSCSDSNLKFNSQSQISGDNSFQYQESSKNGNQ